MISPAQAPDSTRSWFVEASAGTGKTYALVNAIVDAIATGIKVERIVAVTFTNIAAGQMKLRVRHELEERRRGELDSATKELLSTAARELDRASIGTIHAFCAQLLRRRPVEAGVDPVFRELAQPDAIRVFGRVFRRWIEKKLTVPSPALRRALARLSSREERNSNEPLDDLRRAAWALAEWRDFDAAWEQRPFDRDADLKAMLAMAEATLELRNRCGKSYDILHAGLQPLAEFVERLRLARRAGRADRDLVESELLSLPWNIKWLKQGNGQYGQGVSREAVFGSWKELEKAIGNFQRLASADLASSLRDELWEVVGLYQEEKRRAGELDFLDLLIQARVLLRNDAARKDLQNQYERVFVDEFQDTDPLQAEILVLLAAADSSQRNWRLALPAPGKLYVVGDPKQSIYRFRRADAQLFRQISEDLKEGVSFSPLTRNWRSTTSIQTFVNSAFDPQIKHYLALEGGAPAREGQPFIVALPMPEPYGTRNLSNARIEECSPNAVAAFIQWLVNDSKWLVRDPSSEKPEWIPIKENHICILFRRFTNRGTDLTQEYVRCLESRKLPHVLVGSKSLHQREEVGAIRVALKAIEWPDDELSVFAVLRGNLFAVNDETLLKFRNSHKRFHPMMALPPDLDPEFAPIRVAFELLTDLHRKRNYRPIADTINQLLEGVRAHVGFAFRKGGERVIANVYRLIDLARSYEISDAGTSFRAFVEHLEDEYQGSDASEAPVLEQEGNGVHLMTVHRAKGLEFPIVILADMTAKLTRSQSEPDRYCDLDRRLCAQRLLGWGPWELLNPEIAQQELDAEREEAIRVAYVAATRARDLLVVSVIGADQREGGWLSPLQDALYPPKDRWGLPGTAPGCPPFGNTTVLNRPPDQQDEVSIKPGLHYPKVGTQEVVWFDPRALQLRVEHAEGVEHEQILTGTSDQALEGLRRYNEWKDRRQSRNQQGAIPSARVLAAETLREVHEAEHIAVQVITLPTYAGRPSGKTFGRVVHDIMQHAGAGSDVESLAEVYGRKHGASESVCKAAAETAYSALRHPMLSIPPGSRQYREFPVVVRLDDGSLVEGRVDLAWSDGSSWTVVDYKTDRRDKRTSAQLQVYGLAIQLATGLPVRGILLEV